jgi:hypothetical protein
MKWFSKLLFRYIVGPRISVTNILSLYLAFLHAKGYSASSNSAIGYYHKLGGFPDSIGSFYFTKLLQGTKRKCPSIDGRFPITLSILHKLIDALDLSYNSEYNRSMYKSMFLCFFMHWGNDCCSYKCHWLLFKIVKHWWNTSGFCNFI